MVYVADSDYSADANSGMRQVLYFFPECFCSHEEIKGERSLDKALERPNGSPKVRPGPCAEKKFCLYKWGPNNLECSDLP